MNRLVKQSSLRPFDWDSETYCGDGLEALCEVLINASPIDKRLNIIDYQVWNVKEHGADMGIDGCGVGFDGLTHCVQIKFRTNTQNDLTANHDHISNFVAMSETFAGADRHMTLITTAKGLRQTTNDEMYGGKVRTLGYEQLSKLVDENTAFWQLFLDEMKKV